MVTGPAHSTATADRRRLCTGRVLVVGVETVWLSLENPLVLHTVADM